MDRAWSIMFFSGKYGFMKCERSSSDCFMNHVFINDVWNLLQDYWKKPDAAVVEALRRIMGKS